MKNAPTTETPMKNTPITIERIFAATPARLWDLWTTKEGIEAWWGPEGFQVDVVELDLRSGGLLHYTMTATAPPMVEYMKNAGMPLTNAAHCTYGEIHAPHSFIWESLVDFVPDVTPYTISNRVELMPVADGTKVVLTVEPLHDADWTGRLVQGRTSQFDKLQMLLESETTAGAR
jgi:uncharacterized protein YndB with AHSA1/START domain